MPLRFWVITHLAEDAAQEAFVEAYRELPNLREAAAFAGWFRRIIFNMTRESRSDPFYQHNYLFRWEQLTEKIKDLDRAPVRNIPAFLAEAGYEVFVP